MARKSTVLIAILIATIFLLGGKCGEYIEHTEYAYAEIGDGYDLIAERFYPFDKRDITWEVYRLEIRKLNNNGKMLHPGDIVEIKYYD